jgi:phosphatidyl-myo-inositol dimannoside synthase
VALERQGVEDLPARPRENRIWRRQVKILAIAQVFPPARGGSGRWLWDLYRRLDSADLVVAAGHARGDDVFDRSSSVRTVRLPLAFPSWGVASLSGAFHYMQAWRRLAAIVRRHRPDAIQAGKGLPEGLLAAALGRQFRLPYSCFVHGEELTLARGSRELSRLMAGVLRRAHRIIANSQHTRTLLRDGWSVGDERVVVLHPGVDTAVFTPAPYDPVVRSELGWGGRPVILTVGALQKRKGQDMMIRALPAIRRRCPDVLYSIVGEGWEQDYLRQLAVDQAVQDHVEFRGAPSDRELIACYQQCDLFALPNRAVGWDFEGFGIVLLEAQSCGKPVVTGASGGTIETIEDGRTGIAVACESPDALSSVVADLLEDPERRQAMGCCGRRRAVEQFDWAVIANRIRKLFSGQECEYDHTTVRRC